MSDAFKSSIKGFYARDKKMPLYFKQYKYKYYKVNNEDEVVLDLIPYKVKDVAAHSLEQNQDIKEGEYWPWLLFGLHSLGQAHYVCPATFGEICYICEKRKELASKYPKEKLRSLNQKKMLAMYISRHNVYPVQAEIFITPYNTFGKQYIEFLEAIRDDRKYTVDEKDGCSLELKFRLKQANGFQYYELAILQLRERPRDRLDEIWGTLPSLEPFLERTSNDRLERIYKELCQMAKRSVNGNPTMPSNVSEEDEENLF